MNNKMSWQTLDNSISADLQQLYFPPGYDSVAQYLYNHQYNFYDLYPFKIITLQWGLEAGLFIKQNIKPLDVVKNNLTDSNTISIYRWNVFDKNSKYFALGDVIVSTEQETDKSKIPVILIANDAKVINNLVSFDDLTEIFSITNANETIDVYWQEQPEDDQEKIMGLITNNHNSSSTVHPVYPIVQYKYFFINNSSSQPNNVIKVNNSSSSYIDIWHYNMTYYNSVSGDPSDLVDILPNCLKASFCTNLTDTLYPNIPTHVELDFTNYLTCDDKNEFMNYFCQGRNTTLETCWQYCSTEDANCDQDYTTFCTTTEFTFQINSSNSYFIDMPYMDQSQLICQLVDFPNTIFQNNKDYVINNGFITFVKAPTSPPIGANMKITADYTIQPPNPNNLNSSYKFKETCSCFSTPLFDAWYKNTFGPALKNPESKKWLDSLGMNPNCNLPACRATTDAIKQKTAPSCPNQQIQVCVNDQKVNNNKGTFDDSPIDMSSFICCYQQSDNNSIPGQPNCSSMTSIKPIFLYIFGVIVLAILIFIAYKLIKKN